MSIPTRTDIATLLESKKGQGRVAMRSAVSALPETYPDMTEDQTKMILDDLLSYGEYLNEPESATI